MKKVIVLWLCLSVWLLAACTAEGPSPSVINSEAVPTLTTAAVPAPSTTPVPTVPAETASPVTAIIEVRDGDTLVRDIIPQLTAAFSMTEEEIKGALADTESTFIGKAKGFRRMEGMVAPGTYEIKGEDLSYWISRWTEESEHRYERIAAGVFEKNGLGAGERIILASVVEADTNLADSYESTVANVYLNRIKKNDTFGSCPTVEYALGYQRPFLLKTDFKIDSEYNTYKHKGLPPGPICCFDDESLAASIAEYSDKKLYFFFYDYVKKEIMAFESYNDFQSEAKKSRALYETTINSDRFVMIEDKREYFATGG